MPRTLINVRMVGVNQIHARPVKPVRTVAVICDPEAAPAEIANHLCRVLPLLLAETCGGTTTFDVLLHAERLPIGKQGDQQTLIEHAAVVKRQRGWHAAICVTDLPLCGENNEPLVADLSVGSSVAVISLPAFGAPRLRRRVTEVSVQILRELFPFERGGPTLASRDLRGPFRLIVPEGSGIDAQVVADRGLWRQLVGMVRANRPWRLWRGLRKGIVAALAFSTFWLINPTVWQLGTDQSTYRLTLVALCVITAMVIWLIFYHHLWLHGDKPADRQQVFLFNASTVLTFALGLGIAFIVLAVVNFLAARLLLSDSVVASQLGSPPGIVEYVKLSWMATAGATVIGALGTGFETEEDVRQAVYSQREAERAKQWRDDVMV
ncbi:hypothetical protein [Mycolicibacterium iranicum]|uniref:hypothetical protein n=1 Tax=Mycolicibacterium iranicum TaxID=912594 RepID=UPI0010544BB9|nr:hypothetical protein [Mycolicibacterium iranicum]